MDTKWINILIDIGVLSLIGLAYYFYQKKKIIRHSAEEIQVLIEEFRIKINEFADFSKNNSNYHLIKNYCDCFEQIYQDKTLKILQQFQNFQQLQSSCLSNELKEELRSILTKMEDYLQSQ